MYVDSLLSQATSGIVFLKIPPLFSTRRHNDFYSKEAFQIEFYSSTTVFTQPARSLAEKRNRT